MAAKSKKVAAKKALKKKTPAKKAVEVKTKAETVEVGIVPDLMHPEVTRQIAQVEGVIEEIEGMSDPKLIECIRSCATRAATFSRQALEAGASALVYAWACGKLLNAAKENLGHGAFGKWRKEHLESEGISERTSTRYMKLAARCHDIRGLLQWAPTLKQAYIECGILPETPEREKEESVGDEPAEEVLRKEEEHREKEVLRKKEVLLASVSDLQQKLHQGIGIKKDLDQGELRQLKLARIQINDFFNQILGKES